MASNLVTGRDGIKLLKQALGLPDWPCRSLRIEAAYNSAVAVEMVGFGRNGAQVERTSETPKNADRARYEVVVTRRDSSYRRPLGSVRRKLKAAR